MLPLGQIVATVGVIAAFAEPPKDDPLNYLARHSTGDWGEVAEQDRQQNAFSAEHGRRVLSAYTLRNRNKIWVITEADRSSTCLLLPEEY